MNKSQNQNQQNQNQRGDMGKNNPSQPKRPGNMQEEPTPRTSRYGEEDYSSESGQKIS